MTILDTDTTNGWVRGACAGSAGYAPDDNDLFLLSGGVNVDSNGITTVFNHAKKSLHIAAYGIESSISYVPTGGVFNRGFLMPYYRFDGADVTIPANSDFTIRAWLQPTLSWESVNAALFVMNNIMDTASRKTLYISFVFLDGTFRLSAMDYQNVNDTRFSVPLTTIGMSTSTFSYLTIIKTGNVLTFFVNGANIGSYTMPSVTTSAFTISLAKQISSSTSGKQYNTPSGHYLMDYQVSKVARNGAFVPGNVFGF